MKKLTFRRINILPIVTYKHSQLRNRDKIKIEHVNILQFSGHWKTFFIDIAGMAQFVARFLKNVMFPPYELSEIWKQCYKIGYRSLILVAITGFIMGLVLTLQARPTLAELGAESWLPAMLGISIVREIGPVITAIICAGKIGSGIGAELGAMKVSEQIEAMEVSGTNPFKYLVVSRVLATTLMVPVLAIFSVVIALYGAYLAVNMFGNLSGYLFLSQAFEVIGFSDIIPAIVKTFFFGFAIGIIGCYMGFTADSGTEGVGKAANSAVVYASLTVFIIDMIAVQITNFFMF